MTGVPSMLSQATAHAIFTTAFLIERAGHRSPETLE
jgi:hypothetical protein